MKVDGMFGAGPVMESTESIVARAQQLEELGYDGLQIAEVAHDPFLPLVLAAHQTSKIELRTSIAVAFARGPMNLANVGHDLNALSNGRFVLGLGSQIRPHIVKRFSMPWHGPAKQMREMIEAINAIWDCWYDGKPLKYTGEFYQHTLMTPEFTPPNQAVGRPKVLLAAVGPLMVKTAAQVADGIIIHPFCTEAYLKEVILPVLEGELASRGKTLDDFQIQYPAFMATGDTEEQLNKSREAIRYRIGYYASTPAYKGVLDLHGWGDIQPVLNRMTKEGKWNELAGEISDEVLKTFAAVGEPVPAAKLIKQRFDGVVDRVTLEIRESEQTLAEQMSVIRGTA
ncbi:MAG: TIGR03617 family F420-dependent LLM class oxidoreductase [Gammaproteobacteria bacterium]|nr:TIGR03617 family F420-dependent LLM class oxidoreductase [Gammaproteobacteria bacterium]